MARVRAWCARESTRTLLWDTLLAAALIAGCVPFNGVTSPDSTGGILFPATQASMTLWSLPVFVPLMLRRYRPEPAAWLFVALTITHLVLGPAITYFDFYALIMVYSVILYGSPRHSWRFIVTAFVMGLVAATVWSVSFNVGPLFAGPSSGSRTIRDGWLADAITMPTCPAVTGVVGASGAVNCGAKMLADVGMEAALIESSVLTIALTIIMLSPLAFRRRFPEGSALVMAILSAVQLLFLPSILTVNMFALVSVHAAVLYGREHAWRWVSVALVADSWLAGIKIMSGWNGYGMLIQMLLPFNGESAMSRWLLVLSGLMPGGVVMLFGFACIAMARWSRSRGSNALVLMQREEALKAEQERQKVLAANLERNRIGTAMQAEVLNTLESVITQADDGLAMLNSEPAPDSEQIIAAFTVIGERGRAALAHMRQLLTVLRETGFSDEMHEGAQPDMQLRPAAPLSSQMRQAESTSQTDSSTNMNSGNNQGVHGAALR